MISSRPSIISKLGSVEHWDQTPLDLNPKSNVYWEIYITYLRLSEMSLSSVKWRIVQSIK